MPNRVRLSNENSRFKWDNKEIWITIIIIESNHYVIVIIDIKNFPLNETHISNI